LPSDEIFCDIDGSQVQKLEKLVGALRALVPSDEERCTILGNELRNALEHRGLSVQIHTVMRMLEDADQIELTKGHWCFGSIDVGERMSQKALAFVS
jgi:hypothetical protein